ICVPASTASCSKGKSNSSPARIKDATKFETKMELPSVRTHSVLAPFGFVLTTLRRHTLGNACVLTDTATLISSGTLAPVKRHAKLVRRSPSRVHVQGIRAQARTNDAARFRACEGGQSDTYTGNSTRHRRRC